MEQTTYIKCRSSVMTYVDPQTKFVIPRGKIVPLKGPLTKTMRRWVRRGGLKVVEEALYLQQQEHEKDVPSAETPAQTETPVAEDETKEKEAKVDTKTNKSSKKKSKKTAS